MPNFKVTGKRIEKKLHENGCIKTTIFKCSDDVERDAVQLAKLCGLKNGNSILQRIKKYGLGDDRVLADIRKTPTKIIAEPYLEYRRVGKAHRNVTVFPCDTGDFTCEELDMALGFEGRWVVCQRYRKWGWKDPRVLAKGKIISIPIRKEPKLEYLENGPTMIVEEPAKRDNKLFISYVCNDGNTYSAEQLARLLGLSSGSVITNRVQKYGWEDKRNLCLGACVSADKVPTDEWLRMGTRPRTPKTISPMPSQYERDNGLV